MTSRMKSNLTEITFAHATNSQEKLREALKGAIDMIEVDITLGKLNDSGPTLPVLAHPPLNSSDISLHDFFDKIFQYNKVNVDKQKGIKLDFKSTAAFKNALNILHEKIPLMSCPIWLNADIIPGPINAKIEPVEPMCFLSGCAPFKELIVLSIGWTTEWGSKNVDGCYTICEINSMLKAIKRNYVTQAITFAVRAGIAANSRQELHNLIKVLADTNDTTLTVWSSENDFVNTKKLRELIFSIGLDRVYLDVPEELLNDLNLSH